MANCSLFCAAPGVSSRSTTATDDTPLHLAIREGKWITATLLIDHDVDLNARNESGVVPLQSAISKNNLALAHAMFERGASPDILYDSGQPALIAAITAKEGKAARAILHHDANPNVVNRAKASPLYLAIRSSQAGLVPDLLRAGADPNGTTPEGQPLLNFICEQYKACGLDDLTPPYCPTIAHSWSQRRGSGRLRETPAQACDRRGGK